MIQKILFILFLLVPSTFIFADELSVAVIERPPFAFQDESKNWTGFSVELITELSQRSGHTVTFVPYEVFSQMIGEVRNSNVDVAAANISITSQREEFLDFTQPIYESGLQILIPQGSSSVTIWNIIWESGILLFVFGAFIILMIVAHLVWFFERGGDAKHDYFRDEYFGGLWDAFWWAFIVVTMGGFENERPENYIGRVIAIFWVLASLFFISTLTAKITTALTISELQTGIESYEDLRGKKVGAPTGTTISDFLDKQNISYVEYDDFSQVINDLEGGGLDAAVGGAAVSQYYAANEGAGKLVTAGEVFAPDNIGLALPEDSQYFEELNTLLIETKEDGTYERLLEKYFGE